ncbi:hypothetical protein B0I37DRAFT_385035 [Chaetomium sp. MPI-CAGE-AT-0009]|nr:hypothetical protein B0I37DRAFT_385035 [Chaetomium sp. MPI-CAGE-AT-0009]
MDWWVLLLLRGWYSGGGVRCCYEVLHLLTRLTTLLWLESKGRGLLRGVVWRKEDSVDRGLDRLGWERPTYVCFMAGRLTECSWCRFWWHHYQMSL